MGYPTNDKWKKADRKSLCFKTLALEHATQCYWREVVNRCCFWVLLVENGNRQFTFTAVWKIVGLFSLISRKEIIVQFVLLCRSEKYLPQELVRSNRCRFLNNCLIFWYFVLLNIRYVVRLYYIQYIA